MGMSAIPQSLVEDSDDPKFMELLILLPKRWPLKNSDFLDENNYWPLRLLKDMARYGHRNQISLGYGHTIANAEDDDENLVAYAENNSFIASVLLPSITLGDEAFVLEQPKKEENVYFFAVIPLYKKELDFKINNDIDQLIDLFHLHKLSDILDMKRVPVVT